MAIDRHSFATSSWFQDTLSKFQDDPNYINILNANPFLNFTRHQTGWQKFLSNLGFNTKFDAYSQQMEQAAKEYNANAVNAFAENDYNSYEKDAQRMRAAGLNPDLLGVQGQGQASFDESPNPVSPTPPDPSEQVSTFVSGLGGVLQSAFGMVQNIGSISNMFAEVESRKLGNSQLFSELAKDSFLTLLPPDVSYEDLTSDDSSIAPTIKRGLPDFRSMYPGQGNRFYRKLEGYYKPFRNSVLASRSAYENLLANFNNRSEYLHKDASEGAPKHHDKSLPIGTESNEVLSIFSKHLVSMNDKISELSKELEQRQLGVDSANMSVTEQYPGEQAQTQHQANLASQSNSQFAVTSNESAEGQKEYLKIFNDTISSIVKDLVEFTKKGDRNHPFANVALLFLSLYGTHIMSSNFKSGFGNISF